MSHVGAADGRVLSLDGVRGIAVLLVMQYHFAHTRLASTHPFDILVYKLSRVGWIGVDLFFVLSGFLITGILLGQRGRARYFLNFYGRRFLRIFPLYYLYVAFVFLLVYPVLSHRVGAAEQAKMAAAVEAWPWFVLHVSNIKQFLSGVFFGAGFGHLWSLAIEEQFYLVWPLVVALAGARHLVRICCVLLALSLVARVVMTMQGVNPEGLYVLTFTRLDGLLCGAILACRLREGAASSFLPPVSVPWLVAGAVAVPSTLLALGSRPEAHPAIYTVGFLLIALYFSYVVLAAHAMPASAGLRRFFESRLLQVFGTYSYALYLIHPLVRNLVDRLFGTPILLAGSQLPWQLVYSSICTVLSLLLAALSWRFLESPILRLKRHFQT